MDTEAVYSLHHALADHEATFLYSGSFHDEHTVPLIALGEQFVGQDEPERNRRNRLTFIMVEAYQNIIRHRAWLPDALARRNGRSLFALHKRGNAMVVRAVDPVTNADADRLKEALDRVVGLDRSELKALFLRVLQGGTISERGGAGLGIIEMARRSGGPLDHHFAALDDGHQLFTLQVALGERYLPEGSSTRTMDLHAAVAQHDILLLHHGRQLPGVLEAMLRMVQRDMEERPDKAKARTRAFLAATEVLQALDPHAGHDGLLLLHGAGEGYGIALGTWLTPERASEVRTEIEALNALPIPELNQRYRELLKADAPAESHLLMGLLELARHRQEPLSFDSRPGAHGEFAVLLARV